MGGCEPTLMEVGEGDDVAEWWCRQIMAIRQQPLIRIHSRAKETLPDETLHTREGDGRVAPRLHGE